MCRVSDRNASMEILPPPTNLQFSGGSPGPPPCQPKEVFHGLATSSDLCCAHCPIAVRRLMAEAALRMHLTGDWLIVSEA